MVNLAEQMNELNNTAVLSAARLSKLSLDSAERLLALQLGFAKSALGDATRSARAAAGTQDVQQLLALRTKAAETAMTQWLEYSRSLYEVASDAQAELSKLTHENEPDTFVYDIIRSRTKPDTYVVYARFKDEAAFQFHQATPFHDRLVPPIMATLGGDMDLQFYDWIA